VLKFYTNIREDNKLKYSNRCVTIDVDVNDVLAEIGDETLLEYVSEIQKQSNSIINLQKMSPEEIARTIRESTIIDDNIKRVIEELQRLLN